MSEVSDQILFEKAVELKPPAEIDLMSDELTYEQLAELEMKASVEYATDLELKTALKYGLLVFGMIRATSGKPKQGILLHRLSEAFKKIMADFTPDYRAIRELMDIFRSEVEEVNHGAPD